MRFDILTIFPGMFVGPLTESIIKRAVQAGHLSIALHDIRSYATDRHRTTDDAPYGGGAGMVMKAEPLAAALQAVLHNAYQEPDPIFPVLTPQLSSTADPHEPVSYTHLDVYKRQGYRSWCWWCPTPHS